MWSVTQLPSKGSYLRIKSLIRYIVLCILSHSSVSIVRGYGLGFNSTLALGPTQPLSQWVLGSLSQGVELPGCEADHSPPSSAEVKNGGAIPPLSDTSLWRGACLVKHRDNFTCNYILLGVGLFITS
jgi:hypothetical protein